MADERLERRIREADVAALVDDEERVGHAGEQRGGEARAARERRTRRVGRVVGARDHDEEARVFGAVREREHRELERRGRAVPAGDLDPRAREAAAFAELLAQGGALFGTRDERHQVARVEPDVGFRATTQLAEPVAHRSDAAHGIGDENVSGRVGRRRR